MGKNSGTLPIEHLGITDSGPAFSSFITGKIANKYEGSLTKIDNIFKQFRLAHYKVWGYGYNYPIHEMVGSAFFEKYVDNGWGLFTAASSLFVDAQTQKVAVENVVSSLVFDK